MSQKADRARLGTLGLPDFCRPGPPWGVPGLVRHRRPAGSLVPCTGGMGTIVLWFPTRAEHGWRRSVTLLQAREEEEEDKEEKRREILIGAHK